ncbi:MAG: alpha/beta hydrolase [Nocardioides sp.]
MTEPPSPALAAYYDQKLRWSGCRETESVGTTVTAGFGASVDMFELARGSTATVRSRAAESAADVLCSTLKVPLDYAKPAGVAIKIALLRVPAEGERIGALVVNPGGPGAPGTSYAEAAGRVFRDPLRESFDIVGFDPRGTGRSNPVDCLGDDELDRYVAADPDPDTAREIRRFVAQVRKLGAGCAARSGSIARHVSTVEAARDMDILRAALGEGRLTYFGASYGTKLGATYADLFPKRVGRLVLDGGIDLSLGTKELGTQQAAGFEVALRAYVDNCVEQTKSCFLGDSTDAGLTRIQRLLADIEKTPLSTDLGARKLEVGNAFYGLVAPLYQREAWSALSLALRSALEGDGTTLLQFSDLYTSRGSDGYTDNSLEANVVVNCLDHPGGTKPSRVDDSYEEYEAAAPTFGRVFAWSAVGCLGFRSSPATRWDAVRAVGAAPILVVGTTRDPATPMRWSEALAAQLDSGVLLRRDGDGHTAYNVGNECIDSAIEAYLVRGIVPPVGTSC